MKKMRKLLAFVMALTMILSLAACGAKAEAPVETTQPALETEAAPETTAAPETEAPKVSANVMVLNGTTGFGMANLMDAAANGEAALDYTFSVETDASNIVAALPTAPLISPPCPPTPPPPSTTRPRAVSRCWR